MYTINWVLVFKWIVQKYGEWGVIIQMQQDDFKSLDLVNAENNSFVIVQVVDFFVG
jgi:hypothetical protein